ncbi:MAG: sulfotransferase family protein [Geminicoccaceae bacterium]|nr:MAG: sulfotransferase family protein [Geminicoccaceae bacterium]
MAEPAHDAAPAARLVVVLCPERSGSTLLAAMLGAHPRVLAPPELHLLRYPDLATWRRCYPAAAGSLAWLLQRLDRAVDAQTLERELADLPMIEVYRRLLARCGPDRILVDKTPAYARDDAILARIEQLQPVYVRLLRHPLAVAASWLDREAERIRERAAAVPRPVRGLWTRLAIARERGRRITLALGRWTDVHERLDRFLASLPADRQVTVRYEALVREPEAEGRRLCRALGIEWSPTMLEPDRHLPAPTAWRTGDEKIRRIRGVDPARAEAWRDRLGAIAIPEPTVRLMTRLGYPRD